MQKPTAMHATPGAGRCFDGDYLVAKRWRSPIPCLPKWQERISLVGHAGRCYCIAGYLTLFPVAGHGVTQPVVCIRVAGINRSFPPARTVSRKAGERSRGEARAAKNAAFICYKGEPPDDWQRRIIRCSRFAISSNRGAGWPLVRSLPAPKSVSGGGGSWGTSATPDVL